MRTKVLPLRFNQLVADTGRCMQQNQYGFEENTNQIEPEIQNLQGKMITRNTLINEPFEYVLKINHTKEEDDEEEACNTIGPL